MGFSIGALIIRIGFGFFYNVGTLLRNLGPLLGFLV